MKFRKNRHSLSSKTYNSTTCEITDFLENKLRSLCKKKKNDAKPYRMFLYILYTFVRIAFYNIFEICLQINKKKYFNLRKYFWFWAFKESYNVVDWISHLFFIRWKSLWSFFTCFSQFKTSCCAVSCVEAFCVVILYQIKKKL